MILITEISKTFKNTSALKNISINFPDKGLVFITGKSGCGKSTLLNIIGGLEKYDTGTITIDGKSTANFKKQDFDFYRNTYIGFVFQDFNLIENLTVFDNVKIALNLQGISDEKSIKLTENALKKVELIDKKNSLVKELSGGQKQRVAVARAVVKNPKIILADEPTGNLDSKTSIVILEMLKKMSKDRLVIMVTHDVEYANKYADRVIELKDGKIISDDASNFKNNFEIAKISKDQDEISNVIKISELDSDLRDKLSSHILKEDTYILTSKNINYINKCNKDESLSIDSKSSSVKNFELNNSKLPFKIIRDMVFNNLKIKKLRLFSTFIMFTISLALFSLALIFSSYNEVKTYTRALDEIETKQFKFYSQYDRNGRVTNELYFSDIESIIDNNPDVIIGYHLGDGIFSDNIQNAIYNPYADEAIIGYLDRNFATNTVVSELDRLPVEIIAGTKVTTETNVIVIPDFVANYIIYSGLVDFGVENPSYSDILDKHIYELGNISIPNSETRLYKIIGVYETNTIDLLKNIEQSAEATDVMVGILRQYSIYVKTDIDKHDLFSESNSAYFVDGSDELALQLLTTYDISSNIVLEQIDSASNIFTILSIAFLVLLIIFTVFAIMLMYQFISMTIEYSKKEIGILKALGTRSSDIFKVYLLETLLIMIVVTISTLLVVTIIFNIINGNLSSKTDSSFDIVVLSGMSILFITLFSIVISFISTYKPIKTITKAKPIEVIRDL